MSVRGLHHGHWKYMYYTKGVSCGVVSHHLSSKSFLHHMLEYTTLCWSVSQCRRLSKEDLSSDLELYPVHCPDSFEHCPDSFEHCPQTQKLITLAYFLVWCIFVYCQVHSLWLLLCRQLYSMTRPSNRPFKVWSLHKDSSDILISFIIISSVLK